MTGSKLVNIIKIMNISKSKKNESPDVYREIRRLGVFIERVDDNVKLVAEQRGNLKEDIGGIKEDVVGIKETLDSHTDMIGNLAVGLEVVKSDLDIVKKDVKTTKVDIEIIKSDIEFIKNSVKKKIDVDEFAALERRVLLLEKRSSR